MIFESHILEEPLIDFIESIFYYKGFKPDHSIERVVPTGHLFIIFELDGIERNTFNNESLKPNGSYREVWVSGIHKNHLTISAHQDSEMMVIQFKTNGAYPFFKTPIHNFNNKVIPAEQIFGDDILTLRKNVLRAQSIPDKFNYAETWLLNRYDQSKSPPEDIVHVLEQIRSKPFSKSREMVDSYPNSQKHFISQFKKYFGLTPKVLHRIFRFDEILKQIQNNQQLNWSDIAYEFGYTDQSHFIKEFREFSGFSPQEYINADYHKIQPNFFPLDREG